MSQMSSKVEECTESLDPSEIGTKDYWDSFYDKEVENFIDHGDIGDIWFGKAMLQKIVQWIDKKDGIKHENSIIDLGCGNGWTLIMLAKLGYTNLTGVDYSENAIELAKSVAKTEDFLNIDYQVYDLVDSNCCSKLQGFKVAVDKGTYDAISLSPDDSNIKRCKYKTNVAKLICDNGFLIISSCNWTEQELIDYFKDYFDFTEAISPPKTFQFGGKTGNEYSTVVLQKRT
ncbi:EEF1A lysine methyltransferase 2 isoform X1 [Lycorma delicatula]|uniref:EEF1A lysine methyltransferase 2 isoform X1 n=1 Tax=Lycorma delicatula TaxID=130591 RepID=UPI003F5198D5